MAKHDEPCPRCGARKGEPCEPIRPGKYPTILREHTERGARPWWLNDRGYIPYTLEDAEGFKLFLWRRPRQPAVTRDGFKPVEGGAGR